MTQPVLITVLGPTASGKTQRGVALAKALGGEIISGDSRQVYRGMDIGTGKDLAEYDGVPYHLIDIAPAGYKYNLYEYIRDARKAINDIHGRGKVPIVVGGTGLYVETLLKGLYLPEVPENKQLRQSLEHKSLAYLTEILSGMKTLHNVTDVDTPKRAIRAIEIATFYEKNPGMAPVRENARPFESVNILIDIDRDERRKRITERLYRRLEQGMVNEVRMLLESGVAPDDLMYYGLEYKFITAHIIGQLTYDEMVRQLEIAIHQFAKRQLTWFRGMERRGFNLHRLSFDMTEQEFIRNVTALYETLLENQSAKSFENI